MMCIESDHIALANTPGEGFDAQVLGKRQCTMQSEQVGTAAHSLSSRNNCSESVMQSSSPASVIGVPGTCSFCKKRGNFSTCIRCSNKILQDTYILVH